MEPEDWPDFISAVECEPKTENELYESVKKFYAPDRECAEMNEYEEAFFTQLVEYLDKIGVPHIESCGEGHRQESIFPGQGIEIFVYRWIDRVIWSYMHNYHEEEKRPYFPNEFWELDEIEGMKQFLEWIKELHDTFK